MHHSVQADTMWAHVQYICDKNKADVPITFFENHESRNEPLKLYQTYNVFWSPIESDTPSKVLNRENKVLFVDGMKKSTNRKNLPLAGYYKAVLLKLADSEEELQFSLQEERTRKPTDVILEGYEQGEKPAAKRKHQLQSQQQRAAAREDILKKLGVGDIDPVPNRRTTKKAKYTESESSENEEVDDDRDSVPFVQYEDLKAKYEKSQEEIKRITSLNLYWQEKYREMSEKNQMKTASEKKVVIFEKSFGSSSNQKTSTETSQYQGASATVSMREKTSRSSTIDKTGELSINPDIDDDLDISGRKSPNEGFLTDDQFKSANKVPSGITGDSKFVKNICDLCWTREELAGRSTTGKACPTKKDSDARPECTPEKKLYIQRLLEKRISLESVNTTLEDRERRTGRINQYIRSKIKTIRRDSGNKAVSGEIE